MLRRNAFVVVALLALIFSAAFSSWTQDTSGGSSNSGPPAVRSFPPDFTKYSRPAIPGDVNPSKSAKAKKSLATKAALATPGFTVVEVPNSGGGEPDLAINPFDLNDIVVHAGFGGWNGLAPNEVSTDGGLTWTQEFEIPSPPGGSGTSGCPCDITHDWGIDGNLYGTYLANDVYSASTPNPFTPIDFAYFLVGGNAEMTDFNVSAPGNSDQPNLLANVDPTTAGQTDVYVMYSDFFDGGTVNERVSVALGTSPPDFVKDNLAGVSTGGGIDPGPRLATDPRTGTIYSLYQSCTANCGSTPKTIAYNLNRSLDAGSTWTLNGSSTGIQVASGVTVQPTPKFGTVNAILGGIDHAAVDPTTGNVFVAFGGDNGTFDPTLGSDGNAVFIVEITFDNSTPSMAIIGTPHQVSLPGAEAALPSVAVAPNGTVGVLYTSFDGFSVDGFPIFTGHFAYSTNAGATFTDQALLTFLSPSMNDGTSRQRVLGDYQQLKVVNNPLPPANAGATFYGVFTGNGAALGDPTANNDAIFFKTTLAPQINLNSNPISIGNVCLGSTGQAQLEVSDTGADNLSITSITQTSGSTDISLAAGPTFPVNISPDANFNFAFSCTPTSVGSKTATFSIASNDPVNPTTVVTATCNTGSGTVTLTGNGNFGASVCSGGTGATQTLNVDNTGTCGLNVASAVLTGCSSAFTLVNPTEFPATISADSGLPVGVNFLPTTGGPQSCNLTVTSNDPVNPVINVPLTGQEGNGQINVTGSGNFGTAVCTGKAPPQTLKINNTGPCSLVVTSAVISCADFTLVNPAEFPATISADSELDLGVNFTPTSAGPKACTLTITSNDPVNPIVVIPLNATTPLGSASLSIPAGLTFPPTVIQQNAACPVQMGVPITNAGTCTVQVNAVTLTESSSPPDYSLTGLPALPVGVGPTGQLGSGDLDLVFEPFTLARESTGTVNVTFVNDPITGTTSTDEVPFCGEAVHRGLRVLVTLGGVPVSTVKRIELQSAFGPQQPNGDWFTKETIKNAALQTITGTAPCPSFQFNAEFGGIGNPRALKAGTYRVKVQIKVGKKTKTKVVRAVMGVCTFTPNVIVAF